MAGKCGISGTNNSMGLTIKNPAKSASHYFMTKFEHYTPTPIVNSSLNLFNKLTLDHHSPLGLNSVYMPYNTGSLILNDAYDTIGKRHPSVPYMHGLIRIGGKRHSLCNSSQY